MMVDHITLLVTIVGFCLAWVAFRKDGKEKRLARKSEKADILKSISAELGFMSLWLGTSYDNQTINGRTWNPFSMVYGLGRNEAIKSAISGRSVTLLSRELLLLLTKFNQLLSNFGQHVDRAVLISSSDPRLSVRAARILYRLPDEAARWGYIQNLFERYSGAGPPLKAEEEMLVATQMVMRDVHRAGIGSSDDPNSLHSTFKKLKASVELELEQLDRDTRWGVPMWQKVVDAVIIAALSLGAAWGVGLGDQVLFFLRKINKESLLGLSAKLSSMKDFGVQFSCELLATLAGGFILYFLLERRVSNELKKLENQKLFRNLDGDLRFNSALGKKIVESEPVSSKTDKFTVGKYRTCGLNTFLYARPIEGFPYGALTALIHKLEASNTLIQFVFDSGDSKAIVANKKTVTSAAKELLPQISRFTKGTEKFRDELGL